MRYSALLSVTQRYSAIRGVIGLSFLSGRGASRRKGLATVESGGRGLFAPSVAHRLPKDKISRCRMNVHKCSEPNISERRTHSAAPASKKKSLPGATPNEDGGLACLDGR